MVIRLEPIRSLQGIISSSSKGGTQATESAANSGEQAGGNTKQAAVPNQAAQNQAAQSQTIKIRRLKANLPQTHLTIRLKRALRQAIREADQLQIKTHYLANKTVTVAYPIHQTMYRHLPLCL